MRIAFAAVVIAVLAGSARAGDICVSDDQGNSNPVVHVKALEKYAKTHKGDDPDFQAAEWCLRGDTKHADRIFKACETILDREPKDEACFVIVASLGKSMLGKHDVYAWVAARPLSPWDVNSSLPNYPLYLFQELRDPRAVKVIVDMWNASIPKAAQKEKRKVGMPDWSGWRQHAAEALGVLGGADEKAFLEDQAKATRDTHVAQACRDAAAAIDKRLAATK